MKLDIDLAKHDFTLVGKGSGGTLCIDGAPLKSIEHISYISRSPEVSILQITIHEKKQFLMSGRIARVLIEENER